MLFAHIEGSGVKGGPKKAWTEYVSEDLEALGLSSSVF